MPGISPLAVVERGARIADDVTVGAFAYVGGQVRIEAGCVIDASATVIGETVIGAGYRWRG